MASWAFPRVVHLGSAFLLCFGAVALSAGCGGKDKQESTLAGSKVDVPEVDPELCDTKGKRVDAYDLNRDNKPDVWKLYTRVEEGGTNLSVLTCKQVDLDHDGTKDYVAIYARTGELIAEEIDLTFDGQFDAREHYDQKTGRRSLIERDSDHDKKPDIWEEYDENGKLKSVRMDRNADGRPDLWEQYSGGELIAILYDDDFDNRVDRKEARGAGAPKPPSQPIEEEPVEMPKEESPEPSTPETEDAGDAAGNKPDAPQ